METREKENSGEDLSPATRAWLISYTHYLIMKLPAEERNVLMQKYIELEGLAS